MKKVIVLVLGLTLLAAACNKKNEANNNQDNNGQTAGQTDNPTPTPEPTPTPTTPEPTPTPSPSPAAQSGEVKISMNSSGFSPSTITVKKGTKVTFVNNDSRPRWPASDPHPTHTDLSGFDARKGIAVGGSYSFTFTKIGTWGMHDHLQPNFRGSITVVE